MGEEQVNKLEVDLARVEERQAAMQKNTLNISEEFTKNIIFIKNSKDKLIPYKKEWQL